MNLLKRAPRPIPSRDKDPSSLRDDRLFIIACDDTYAPQQYFDFFRLSRIKIHVVPTEDGTSAAKHVLERLLKFDYETDDERWLLLDTDHVVQGNHLKSIRQTIRRALKHKVKIAFSKPCFELWLLLHLSEEIDVSTLANAKEVEKLLRNKMGEYNKINLKEEHYPRSSVVRAIQRAEKLDRIVQGGAIPKANTTRIYKLWKEIINKALLSQLPSEFHEFRR